MSESGQPVQRAHCVSPAPRALYTENGHQHTADKAGNVKAVLKSQFGVKVYQESGRSERSLRAKTFAVDVTSVFYSYMDWTADDGPPTIGKWSDKAAGYILSPWVLRAIGQLCILTGDTYRNPFKAFEDLKRHTGVVLPFGGDRLEASTPLPSKENWAQFISNKAHQADVWPILLTAVERWKDANAKHLTVIADGPARRGDGHDENTPIPVVVMPSSRANSEAVSRLKVAAQALYVSRSRTVRKRYLCR